MYLNTQTMQRVSEHEIRQAFPSTSFPTPFQPPEGYVWVFPAPQPQHNAVLQYTRETTPELTNKGTWEQRWEVVSRFSEYTDDQGFTHTVAQQEAAALAVDLAARTQALQAGIVAATQLRLDEFAQTRNYDGILSACTYATSTVTKFQAEGQACVEARDATWATLYGLLAEVQAGTRPVPSSYADIEPLLPALVWPA